ncbi:OsmC family protein [Spongiimicrobium sp. 3-5]|uniref:OsmC family protein n=1 Tax=Spongiimicrobium sp. 3-5 TaxID=3332596 RepID=UPI00397EDF38
MSNTLFLTKRLLRKANILHNRTPVYLRQSKLNEQYLKDPKLAMITDCAEVLGKDLHDPFRTTVTINKELQVPFRVGVHSAVGGDHDHPNPGDMLCATLASCLESTLRMIANRFDITLTYTRVRVSALVDVRGTLRIDLTTPVGFQSMHVELEVAAKGLNKKVLNTLIQGSKKSCIIYQTLIKTLPITIDVITDKPNK